MTAYDLANQLNNIVLQGHGHVEVVMEDSRKGHVPVTSVDYHEETTYAPIFSTQSGPETLPETVVLS